ncbi:MAG TPA: TIM-barrel domain-containing protein [Candidatus Acidoferrum sp.]|nr:TIM-barrel domain-containing protein [Candidatus Acidoferrum sp.]
MRFFTFRPASIPIVAILIHLGLAISSTAAAQTPAAPAPNPVADPRAVIISGQARFTILTPQLIRIEWDDDSKFEDQASLVFINRHMPVPPFKQSVQKGWLTIDTGKLVLRYKQKSGVFTADNLEAAFSIGNAKFTWHPGLVDTGNLGGTIRTLDGARGPRPLDPGLLSRDGWVLVDDSARPLFDNSDWPWAMSRPPAPNPVFPRIDWYLFAYGHDYRAELRDFTQVAGRIPLPPRFAFGVWWSRYWAYTDSELQQLVQEFHDHNVPLDVLVIDMDWHPTFGVRWWENNADPSGHTRGWTGYTWNNLYFPDPPEFLNWAHSEGLRVTLNMHPASGVQNFEQAYPEMARAMGIDPATKQYVAFDIANKKFATNYMSLLHHPLEKQGVDFFWLDWQQEPTTNLPGLNPTWWLNYVHFTDMEREGKRPLIYHRWGGLGNHRYEIGFSGDVISDWSSLAFQPTFTATAANVGYGYWSHDIGGHLPGTVEPELYTRWLQWGAFSPILRTHMTKNPDAERRVWAFSEQYSEIMRDALLLRHALVPYIYTAARETYDTGISICHPLYYDYPDFSGAYDANANGEYAFGDSMIVAPVATPLDPVSQLAKRSIWLPPGDWIEVPTGARLHGSATFDRTFRLDEIPIYVRPGTIIPMQSPEESQAQSAAQIAIATAPGFSVVPGGQQIAPKAQLESPPDPLVLQVFPGKSGDGHLYEDSGDSLDYKGTAFTRTKFQQQLSADGTLKIEISATEGGFPGMLAARAYEIRLPASFPPQSVSANDLPVAYTGPEAAASGWRFDGDTMTTIIELPKFSVTGKVDVLVKYSSHTGEDEDLLNGAAGKIARLIGAMHILERSWDRGWAPDILIDAAQTGRRISLHPDSALAELRRLNKNWPDILKTIDSMDVDRAKFIEPALAHLKN